MEAAEKAGIEVAPRLKEEMSTRKKTAVRR
jgi:hypothetical protein